MALAISSLSQSPISLTSKFRLKPHERLGAQKRGEAPFVGEQTESNATPTAIRASSPKYGRAWELFHSTGGHVVNQNALTVLLLGFDQLAYSDTAHNFQLDDSTGVCLLQA